MALPTEAGAGGPGGGSSSTALAAEAAVIQPQLASVIGSDGQPQQVVAIMPAPLQPNETAQNSIEPKVNLLNCVRLFLKIDMITFCYIACHFL